ncbi:MAG: GDP-mannose 4,6-dehydratase [Planctomycetales bacterium]|nr:GDP-mannose 4,6-dehydratase [Planctomycetales bacterium]
MSILVTGGAGFIGSHLIEILLRQTDRPIVAIDNFNDYYDPRLKRANAAAFADHPQVSLIEGDFCDFAAMRELFASRKFEYVIHLGAYAGVRVSVETPAPYQVSNVGGTLSLLEAARAFPVKRFLLASSSTVYGTGAGIPFDEDAPLGIPASPYGATKRAAELLGLTYHQLHGVPVVVLRPFSVYGPRLRPDLAMTIFTKAIWEGRSFPLYGDGSIRRDFTHVSDICAGLIAALDAPAAPGECMNLGHSEPVEMRQVISMLEAALGKQAVIDRRPERPEDLPVTFAKLAKAERILGYKPQVPFDAGVREYAEWFKKTFA